MDPAKLKAQHILSQVSGDQAHIAARWLAREWPHLSRAERVEVMKLLQREPLGGAAWASMQLIWATEVEEGMVEP